MAKRWKKGEMVSASEVGRAAFCPRYLELKYKGHEVSQSAITARAKGNERHEQLNTIAEDKRCFIASYLYGVDDPRTDVLRAFRDTFLKCFFFGRLFIVTYYALSPYLVSIVDRFPGLYAPLKTLIDHILFQVSKRINHD